MNKSNFLLTGLFMLLFLQVISSCTTASPEEEEDDQTSIPSLTWDGKDPWLKVPSEVDVVSFDADEQLFEFESNVLHLIIHQVDYQEGMLSFTNYPQVSYEGENRQSVRYAVEGNYTLEDRRAEFDVCIQGEEQPLGHFVMNQKGMGIEIHCQSTSSSISVDFNAGRGVSTIVYGLSATEQSDPQNYLKAEGKKISVSGSSSVELAGLDHSSGYFLYAAALMDDWLVEQTLVEQKVSTTISSNPKDDLVFTISANPANDFTVHIPLSFQLGEDRNYTIDWGDGTVETNGEPSHKYNVMETTFFDVKVSGKVTGLDTDIMPSGSLNNTIFAVKQWGNTGLTKVQLCGLSSLESIASDTEGAFSKMLTFGSFDQFSIGSFEDCKSLKSIPADLFKYAVNVTDFNRVFSGCTSLTSVPEELFATCTKATTFHMAFFECSSLEAIPAALFANNTAVRDFSYTFSKCKSLQELPAALFLKNAQAYNFTGTFKGCSSLRSIPKGFLSGCPSASVFGENFRTSNLSGLYVDYVCGMFEDCKSLTSIPDDLLSYCPDAMDVSGLFAGCSALTSIPNGLFDANTKLKYVQGAFQYCNGLEKVPVSLFDHNLKIVLFRNTFAGCVKLSGESPYMMKNGKKVHLYEREDYKFDFPEIWDSTNCFENCIRLTDYNEIRGGWR